MCHGCWTEDKSKDPPVNTVVKGECECDGHHWDNQTNWDMGRREFCGKLNADYEKAHPFPDELKCAVPGLGFGVAPSSSAKHRVV